MPTGAEAFSNAQFGQGTGLILLDDLACLGSEARLVSCRNADLGGPEDCIHAEDASVRCPQPICEGAAH